ncbi:MAG: DUF2723 domain-containing protein [Ignavibacteriales bacterium]|nr:DUF2723 domain-containing protein [Ignavibacteriales bacterium]
MRLSPRPDVMAPVAVSVISFFVYLTTLCPTVSFTDAGELAAVSATLGVAHPTGYPLFTLLGRLAVMIPTATEEIVRLNLLAAVLTSASTGLFFFLILVLQDSSVFSSKRAAQPKSLRFVTAGTTSLIFAFSSTVWSLSSSIEVYSLHLLLILVCTVAFISGLEEQNAQPVATSRYLLFFAFVLGLSFSNHMTTILLAPAFLYLYGVNLGFRKESLRRLLRLVPFFLAGLSAYVYLPIRSSVYPSLDWGHPVSFERFFWHVSGKQYQVWMFEGWDIAKKQLDYFVNHFPSEFHWVVIAVMIVGVFSALFSATRKMIFFSLLFFTCLVYSINYQIHDINSYFLLAFVVSSVFVAHGLLRLFQNVNTKGRLVVAYAFLILLPVAQVWNNYRNADESENFLVEDTTLNVLNELKPNSIVFTSLWDYFVSPSYYYQFVKKLRPDVVVIDKALLQNRSWYFLQLERNHWWFVERSREKIDAFLTELDKFERGVPFNNTVIQSRWTDMLNDIVTKSLEEHHVYADGRVEAEFSPQFQRIPCGLMIRFAREGEPIDIVVSKQNWRTITRETPVSADFRQYYCFMMVKNALALRNQSKPEAAKRVLESALRMDSSYGPAITFLKELARE